MVSGFVGWVSDVEPAMSYGLRWSSSSGLVPTGGPTGAAGSSLRVARACGRRDATTRDELTPQELQVALQVARGLTNREIAQTLFLSPKTIEFHLTRIYRKLDLNARSELIDRFAGQVESL